jgi:RNA polymerase sigma-70 factor (ECF subfamily)
VNGSLAAWQYRPTGPDGAFEPFALMIFETSGGLFTEITTFLGLDPAAVARPAPPRPGTDPR